MRSLFLFYKQISSFNIPFSLVVGLLALAEGGSLAVFFFLPLLTLGFMLSLYLYEVRHANQYFFYFNLGFDKVKLIGFTFGINSTIALIYFLIF